MHAELGDDAAELVAQIGGDPAPTVFPAMLLIHEGTAMNLHLRVAKGDNDMLPAKRVA